jgi:hypothetical protein
MQEVESAPASRRVKAIELNFIICMFLILINIEGVWIQGPDPFAIY